MHGRAEVQGNEAAVGTVSLLAPAGFPGPVSMYCLVAESMPASAKPVYRHFPIISHTPFSLSKEGTKRGSASTLNARIVDRSLLHPQLRQSWSYTSRRSSAPYFERSNDSGSDEKSSAKV